MRVTVLAIAAFAGAVALGLLAIGPWVMSTCSARTTTTAASGWRSLGVGMGFHLTAGTFNQASSPAAGRSSPPPSG